MSFARVLWARLSPHVVLLWWQSPTHTNVCPGTQGWSSSPPAQHHNTRSVTSFSNGKVIAKLKAEMEWLKKNKSFCWKLVLTALFSRSRKFQILTKKGVKLLNSLVFLAMFFSFLLLGETNHNKSHILIVFSHLTQPNQELLPKQENTLSKVSKQRKSPINETRLRKIYILNQIE